MYNLPVRYNDYSFGQRREIRLQYVEQQGGLCYHCKGGLKGLPSKDVKKIKVKTSLFPEGFFKHPVHLHHSHDTGLTLGAVHAYCNAVLWQYYGE